MSAPDLHPEELLDAAAAGVISESEQARLDAHLAACPACRFELTARADFAALPLPSLPVDELVTRALAGMPSASIAATPPRKKLPVPLIAAAVMLVGAASFGAIGLARPIAVFLGIAAPTPPPAPEPTPVPKAPRPHAPRLETPPPVIELVEAPAPEPAAPVEAVPPPRPVIHRPPSPPPLPPAAPIVVTASELFKQATAARSEGRFLDAETSYRALTAQFPTSPEASVAHAVMGRLLLDLGRPAEAMIELDAALASPDESLREDALANRAQALERLQRPDEARATWQQLLAQYPRSLHAKRAKERVEALNGP